MMWLVRRIVRWIEIALIVIYILFEELVWERIAKPIYAYLHRLRVIQKIERYIQRLNAYVLLTLFIVLFVFVELLGLYAGTLIAKGDILQGVVLYGLRVPFAGVVFWLFRISKETLLRFGWFATIYHWVQTKIVWLKSTTLYKEVKVKSAKLKVYIQKLKDRFKGARGSFAERYKHFYRRIKKRLFQ